MKRPARRRAFHLLSSAHKMSNGVVSAERKYHDGLFNERLIKGCKSSGHALCFFLGPGFLVSHGQSSHRKRISAVLFQLRDGIFVLALREQHGAGRAMERSLNDAVMIGIGKFFETC